MFSSFLMGLVGGQRAITPLAAVAVAAATDRLPAENGPPHILSHPAVAAGAVALAVAEMAGDKQKSAPNRIAPAGVAVRFVTSAVAGASLSPRPQRCTGAAIGGATATVASYLGWRIRLKAASRGSRTSAGFLEDAVVLACAAAIVCHARPEADPNPGSSSRP